MLGSSDHPRGCSPIVTGEEIPEPVDGSEAAVGIIAVVWKTPRILVFHAPENRKSKGAKSNLDDLASVFEPRTVNSITGSAASSISLFPGKAVTADSWGDPFAYEPAYLRQQELLDGFLPIGESGRSSV